MMIYRLCLRPILFLLPAEFVHDLARKAAQFIGWLYRLKLWPLKKTTGHEPLETPFGRIDCPLGLAAGFDKNGEALFGWEALGFGFVEVGTVTPRAQPGNPKPRLFRVPSHEALINRLGFNNRGALAVSKNIQKARAQGLKIKIGGNIGKNFDTPLEKAADDYREAASTLVRHVDYLVINVSSPNTPGLRDLQTERSLEQIAAAVKTVSMNKPVFVKVAPDDFQNFIEGILTIIKKYDFAGAICGNTLVNRGLAHGLSESEASSLPLGGLSGKPVLPLNVAMTEAYRKAHSKIFIIGVGGIFEHDDIEKYRKAGAQAFQVYTGFIYGGPGFVRRLLAR